VCAKDITFCTEDGWCWEYPLPQGNTLHAVAASRVANDVWMAGDDGTILRREALLDGGSVLYRVRAPVRANLHDTWVDDSADVWFVGERGLQLRLGADGGWSQWTTTAATWRAIARAAELWVAGDDCTLARFTNGAWITTGQPSGCTAACDLASLSVTPDGGLLVAGGSGNIACAFAFKGTAWTTIFVGTAPPFTSIVEHEGAIILASSSGMWVSDGGVPSALNSSAVITLAQSPGGTLWGVGTGGLVASFPDGGVAAPATVVGHTFDYRGLAFTPDGVGHLAGAAGALARLLSDGGVVSDWIQPAPVPISWADVWAVNGNRVVAAGGGTSRALRTGDGVWTINPAPLGYQPNDIWADLQYDVITASYNALWEDGSITQAFPAWGATGPVLTAVWGFSANDLLVGGINYSPVLHRGPFRTASWSPVVLPMEPDGGVWDIHGLEDAGKAWLGAGNADGPVFLFEVDGGVSVEFSTAAPIRGVFAVAVDDVWAVGLRASIAHKTDAGWLNVDSGILPDAGVNWAAVWATPTEAWVVGDLGEVVRLERGGVFREWPGTRRPLRGAHSQPGLGVWAVGDGAILHRRP
jgi:hypothetical protein